MEHRATKYGLTVAAVLLAAVIRWLLDPFLGDHLPFVTFFVAVAFAAWLGGLRTSVLATVLGLLCALLLFVPPRLSVLGTSGPHLVGLAAYLFVCSAIAAFGEALRIAQARSAESEKLARQQAETLLITFASIGDAVITTDASGNVTYLNTVAQRLTGWPADEAHGEPLTAVFKVINEQSRQTVENPVEKVLKLGQVIGLANHTILVAKDGIERPIDDSAAPIRDQQGQIIGVVLVFHDISDRRKAEAGQREIEQQVAATLESITDGFMRFDPEWRIVHMNAEAERIVGRPRAEVLGKSHWELWPATVGTKIEIEYKRAAAERVTVELENFYEPWGKWFAIKCYPTPDGGLTIFFQDITERKRADNAAQQAKDDLERILNTSSTGLLRGNRNFCYTTVNPAYARIVGLPVEEIVGRPLIDVMGRDAFETIRPRIERALGGERVEYESEVSFAASGKRFLHVVYSPHYEGNGNVVGWVASVTDITKRKQAEAALRQQTATLQAITSTTTDLIFLKDRDCRLLFANPATLAVMGLTEEQALGVDPHKLFANPAEGEPIWAIDRRIMASGVTESVEEVYTGPQGTRTYLSTKTPLRDENGCVIGVIGVSRDITDMKQAELSVRRAESQLRVIMDALPSLISYVDVTGHYRLNNRAYEEWFKHPRREIIGRHMRGVLGEPAWQTIGPKVEAALAGETVTYEAEVEYKDAGRRWINATYVPHFDSDGKVSGIVVLVSDISERKEAEKRLRVSEEQFRRLGEALPLIVTLARPDGSIAYVNPYWTTFSGRSAADFMNGDWQDAIHPDDRQRVLGEWDQAVSRVQPYEYEFRAKAADGEYRWLLARGLPVCTGSGAADFWVNCAADIHDRRLAEDALKEADRKKDEFLSILAHELRNPLAPIRNGLQLMKLASNNENTVVQARTMMERQLGQMVRLIDDLMDLTRISQGKIVLQKSRIPISVAIRNAVETSRPLIEQEGHDLALSVPEQPIYVDADETRLSQVFANLLNNSAKYTERGGRIRLSAEQRENEVVVCVEDNGLGIPGPMLPRVFEMFAQVDRSLEKSKGGLGIGLNIVRRLVEMHDGRIEAQSDGDGKGSRFVVRLPVVSALTKANGTQDQPSTSSGGNRILVVDDNRDAATSLSLMLKIMGHETQTAHNGLEAVDAAAAFLPDVILMDIGMPQMNGYDAARRIREMPCGRDAFIVACTGWGQDEDKRKSEEAGFDTHLVKPVEPVALEKLLAGRADKLRASAQASTD